MIDITSINNQQVKEWKKLHIKTRYYTTNLHRGAFMLPKYLEDMLEDEEDRQRERVIENFVKFEQFREDMRSFAII